MKQIASLALVVAFVGLACSAQASSITYNTTTPIPYTLTDWSGTLSFPKFDSSLGALTQVDIYLRGDFSTVLTVTNSAPSGSTGWAKTELEMSVQDPGNNMSPPQLDILSPQYDYTLGSNESVTSGTLTKFSTSTEQFFAAAVLAEFTGSGSIVLSASTHTSTLLSNTGGNTDASQVTQAKLTGSVTYYYSPVPEPASLALLGIGAVGLMGYCWRRR